MKARITLRLAALGLVGLGLASPGLAQSRGQLKLPEFAGLEKKASESVKVTFDAQLLRFAARFLNSKNPEEAAAQQLVASLTGIYVRKFTFDSDFNVPTAEIEGVRRQLASPGWSQLVEAHSNKENTQVDVYMLIEGGKAQGLAIIASEPREFAIVNIVGSIDLEKLHELEGNFGVPELEIETGKKSPEPKTEPKKK
jgi:Domain of unknown function (DUF4252)